MYRLDHKYDLVIPIKYNFKKPIAGKGSAIFLHLTKNYNSTAGCIALNQNDFLILLKLINRKTKIKII
jgi:L,D-peptidoglycan transpeptidase YkuD (ErfK/YbiS/YcfS/YnhG family)